MSSHRSPVFVGVSTFVATALLTVLALNFTAGEKQVEQKISALYSASDPQFLAELAALTAARPK